MVSSAERLRSIVSRHEPELRALAKPGLAGAGWSPKQELGHLIDSATNNRVRFIRAVLDGHYTGPSYDGPRWVELGGYAEADWPELVHTWVLLNGALASVLDRIPEERLSAPIRMESEGHDGMTLELLIGDYFRHLQQHLDHILGRRTP